MLGVFAFIGAMIAATIVIFYLGKLWDAVVFKAMDMAIDILRS